MDNVYDLVADFMIMIQAGIRSWAVNMQKAFYGLRLGMALKTVT